MRCCRRYELGCSRRRVCAAGPSSARPPQGGSGGCAPRLPGPESPAPEPHPGPGSTQSRRERDSGRERDRTKIQHEPGTAPRTERPATARKHGPPRAPTARPGTPAEGATDPPRSPDPGPRANEPRATATADAELPPQRGLGPPPPHEPERSTGEGTKYTGHRCP